MFVLIADGGDYNDDYRYNVCVSPDKGKLEELRDKMMGWDNQRETFRALVEEQEKNYREVCRSQNPRNIRCKPDILDVLRGNDNSSSRIPDFLEKHAPQIRQTFIDKFGEECVKYLATYTTTYHFYIEPIKVI
jgi:hypothetical protein